MPTQVDGDMVNLAPETSALAMEDFDFQTPMTAMDGTVYQTSYAGGQREGTLGMMSQRRASGFYSEFENRESEGGGIYDGMALPDHFLRQYYAQVRNL